MPYPLPGHVQAELPMTARTGNCIYHRRLRNPKRSLELLEDRSLLSVSPISAFDQTNLAFSSAPLSATSALPPPLPSFDSSTGVATLSPGNESLASAASLDASLPPPPTTGTWMPV